MRNAHRPFWVLRHAITGATRQSYAPDCENGMLRVVLHDGSGEAQIEYQEPSKKRRRPRREPKR